MLGRRPLLALTLCSLPGATAYAEVDGEVAVPLAHPAAHDDGITRGLTRAAGRGAGTATSTLGYNGASKETNLNVNAEIQVWGPFRLVLPADNVTAKARPGVGAAQFLDEKRQGVAGSVYLAYKAEGFTEAEGELEGLVAFGKQLGAVHGTLNLAYGQDPEGKGRDGEVGGALEGAGATAGMVATGEFAAEIVTFTLVSRAGNEVAFGKNESRLAKDLVTNTIMLGSLKAAAAAYGRVFKILADPRVHKVAYAAGAAATGFVALQAFAEAQFAYKHGGTRMDGDERAQSLLQNAVMFAALSLGGFLGKPLNQRVRGEVLLKVAGPRLAAIESRLGTLGAEVEALKTDPQGPDHAAALCKKIEGLWNEELRQLGEAAKAEQQNPVKAAKEFKATVAAYQGEIAKLDLQLSQMGLTPIVDVAVVEVSAVPDVHRVYRP